MSFTQAQLNNRLFCQLAIVQILVIVGIALLFKSFYTSGTDEENEKNKADGIFRYSYFQIVHLMVIPGFAFLLTFIARHRMSSIIICLSMGGFAAEMYFCWAAIWNFVFHQKYRELDIYLLIGGEFAAGSALVAICAVIGKCSNYQYFLMVVLFVPFYSLNEFIVLEIFKARDIGGSMIIHTIGACYGLVITAIVKPKNSGDNNENFGGSQSSYTTALLGTMILWALWPAFNAAQTRGIFETDIAVLNTYLSLIGSVMGTMLATLILNKGRFHLDQMANATLAGGVVIGSTADMITWPFMALLIGTITGIISTILFHKSGHYLNKLKIHDVAGIFNLHFIPGIIGGCISIGFVAIWTDVKPYWQIAALGTSLGMPIIVGLIVGNIMHYYGEDEDRDDFFNDRRLSHVSEKIFGKLSPRSIDPKNKTKPPPLDPNFGQEIIEEILLSGKNIKNQVSEGDDNLPMNLFPRSKKVRFNGETEEGVPQRDNPYFLSGKKAALDVGVDRIKIEEPDVVLKVSENDQVDNAKKQSQA